MDASNALDSKHKAQDKLLFLDGLRGFAALWVLTSHRMSYIGFNGFSICEEAI